MVQLDISPDEEQDKERNPTITTKSHTQKCKEHWQAEALCYLK